MAKHAAPSYRTDWTRPDNRTIEGSARRDSPAHRARGGFAFRGFDPETSTMRVDFEPDTGEN